MAVHFVFGCTTQWFSVPVVEYSISLGKLKDEIYNLKFRKGCEKKPVKETFDFRIFYAETKEEIVGDQNTIARHSHVVVKRVPFFALKALWEKEQLAARCSRKVEEVKEPCESTKANLNDDFGDDVYSTSSSERSSNGGSATISGWTAVQVVKNLNVDLEILIKSSPKATVPPELICSLCNEIMQGPVLIPCCCISFCRKCVVNAILEQHKCPVCGSSKCRDSDLLPNHNTNDRIVSYLKSTGVASHVAAMSSKGSCSSQSLVSRISLETSRDTRESKYKKTLNYNSPPIVIHLDSQKAPCQTNFGGKRKAPQYITQIHKRAKRNLIKLTTK